MWVRWSVAWLCGEVMVCEITDITGVGEVVAFPLCCCPQVDRGTIHIPHSTLPPSPFLDLSHCLSINLSLPHLHPHTYLFPIFHSSHLAFLLATIMVFSPACNCTWISEAIVNLLPFQLFGKKPKQCSRLEQFSLLFLFSHVFSSFRGGCFALLAVPLFWVFAVEQ